MRKKNSKFIISLLILLITYPCYSQKNAERILFTINEAPTPSAEFRYVFNKNNLNKKESPTKEDIDNYLDLYINFKLKVTEARRLGYDTTKAYKEELSKYEDQLAKPYLSEKEVTEQLLKEAYERLNFEIDVSHILISVSPEASPKDTAAAFRKIDEVRGKAEADEDFDRLVLKYSEEPMIEVTKGRLGYFTGLQMVYPFENMAYNTSIGNISQPFRTQFGYHVLKVHDKRPSRGKVNVSHIMLRFSPSMIMEDSVTIRNRIFEIYDQLHSGYDWDLLCKEVSQDQSSKERGGSLSPFGIGEMIPEIAEAAFSLNNIGDLSDPVMTPYGWHILKLDGQIPLPSFEEYKSQLSRRIQRDSRSNKSKEVLIKRLKKENDFTENTELKSRLLYVADSSIFGGSWKPFGEIIKSDKIFSLTDSVYQVQDLVYYINKNFTKSGSGHYSVRFNRLYNLFVEEKLMEYEKAHLEEKYIDYKYLLKEYREGILLFEIMENEVWAKSGRDSIGIAKYYNDNLDNYKVNESASLITFEVDKNYVQSVVDRLTILIEDTTATLESVKQQVIIEFPEIIVKNAGKFSNKDEQWADWIKQGPGIYTLGSIDNPEVIYVAKYFPEQVSELDKIKGQVISDYQDYLDTKWIDLLRKKYKIKIIKKELNKLYKSIVLD